MERHLGNKAFIKQFQVLKWNFDQPGYEHIEQLKTLLGNVTQASLLTFLFNKDFKQQLKGIDILQSVGQFIYPIFLEAFNTNIIRNMHPKYAET